MVAKEYIELTEAWELANKADIVDNIDRIIGYPVRGRKDAMRINQIAEITGVTRHTVVAWLNRSRTDVKPTLISLCRIADYYQVDIYDLMHGKICQRDWSKYDISDSQRRIMMTVNELDVYHHGKWDYIGIINKIDCALKAFELDADGALKSYAEDYVRLVIGVNSGSYMDDMKKHLNLCLKNN